MKSNTIKYMTRLAMLMAIVAVFTIFNIGNIPIAGTIVATLYHIPVIIGAVLLGSRAGCVLGGLWGFISFWLAFSGQTTDAVAISAVNQSVLGYFAVSFLPRFLTGLLASQFYKLVDNHFGKHDHLELILTGIIGSLTNTVGYLSLLVLIFREQVADICSISPTAVIGLALTTAATNGTAEAIISAIVVLSVCRAIFTLDKKYTKANNNEV